jgi:polyhydroxyalkanoate synthase
MNPHTDATAALLQLNQQLLEAALKPLWQGTGIDASEMVQSLASAMTQDAEHWQELQRRHHLKQLEIWKKLATAEPAQSAEPADAAGDRRFRAPEWRQPYFNYLAESYLAAAQWLTAAVDGTKLEPHTKRKLAFFARQWVDAMSPANFPWSNPEAIKLAADTQGESVAAGLKNLAADLDKGLVSMTDERAFEIGRNLAVTPGAVVHENDFLQLIQYRPATATVHERPLVMVPPCINKFYILDLQPENSLVRYAVEQGHIVFVVSWRNMPAAMGRARWDDYLEHGVIEAIAAAREICGVERVNVLGFCVGGTLLACALAVLAARGKRPAHSLTLLATMLDYSDTGELSVFIDEAYVARREHDFRDGGVLHGRELALTFASLRANDLIWNYVVNNYLKGRTPEPFDLLYWNGDGTNLPGAMYAYYIRNMYLENNLRVPRRLTLCGVPVDLGLLDAPAYILASREDHIVPWKTAYASTRLLPGRMEFVLAASGHIAGVINPAARNRRNYWVNRDLVEDADEWLATASSRPGSWWSHWAAWLAEHGGERVPARSGLGGGRYAEIEPAPGRYVREKCGPARATAQN